MKTISTRSFRRLFLNTTIDKYFTSIPSQSENSVSQLPIRIPFEQENLLQLPDILSLSHNKANL